MKKLIIGAAVVAVVVGVACIVSPTARYAMKGSITKIENEVQLRNAVEILETKNVEMQEQYLKLSKGVHLAENQIKQMQKRADVIAAKPKSELNAQKYATYTNGVGKLNEAYAKLLAVRSNMKSNLIKHRSQIELLQAKLVYLDSLKTMNSYMKDINFNAEFGTGVNAIVEEAIIAEEAVAESLNDMSEIKAEMNDL